MGKRLILIIHAIIFAGVIYGQVSINRLSVSEDYKILNPSVFQIIDLFKMSMDDFEILMKDYTEYGDPGKFKSEYKGDSILGVSYYYTDVKVSSSSVSNITRVHMITKSDIKLTFNWNNTYDEFKILTELADDLNNYQLVSEDENFKKYLIQYEDKEYYFNITRQFYNNPDHIVEQISIWERKVVKKVKHS
ncbi:MAG: hypothetical protein JXB49_04595 [Bacteroidales bacterium]|nr:hypothetical protein [Bacteroidales bacterium]